MPERAAGSGFPPGRLTVAHVFFALVTTAYILIAIQFEEHDLISVFGDTYRNYQKRVSMILPWIPNTRS